MYDLTLYLYSGFPVKGLFIDYDFKDAALFESIDYILFLNYIFCPTCFILNIGDYTKSIF